MALFQNVPEIRPVERAFARLVDDRLSRDGRKLGNDLVPPLPADQYASHGADIADPGSLPPAPFQLGRRTVGKVRQMPFPRMHDQQTGHSGGVQNARYHRYYGPGRGNVVPEPFPEPARRAEVVLHVNHNEGRAGRTKAERIRQGFTQFD